MFYHKYGKYFVYVSVFIVLAFTATCRLQPFSSVKVKASPDLYIPLGSRSFSAKEYFSPEKFTEMVSETDGTTNDTDKKARVHNYTPADAPDKEQLRYLVHYPLQSFDFDLDKYFGNNATENGDGLSRKFNKNISIPKIRQTKNLGVSAADINTKLLEKFNQQPTPPISVHVPAAGIGEQELAPVPVNFSGFATITFDTGSYFEISTAPHGVNYEITKAKMESNGHSIPGNITGYHVRFPLDGKEIAGTITLTLTVKNVIGGPGNAEISRTLHGRIIRATGVNAEPEITPAPGSVDIPLPENFQRAKIGAGELKLSMDMPADWTGITIEEQTAITQAGSGGLAITPSSFQPLGTSVSLANKTLNNQPSLTYTPKLKITLTNATYTYQENLSVNFNFSIEEFSEITLANKDNKPSESEPIPDGMKTWIKTIHLNTVTAKIKLNNGLPAGNPIKIKLFSACFGINPEQEKTFNPGETEQTYPGGNNFDLPIENMENFDLKTQVLLPGQNTHDDPFTLKNIKTDSTIKFSGAVRFELDWTEMTVKAKENKKSSFPKDKDLTPSFLAKMKDANMKLDKMPMYFYAGSDLFDNNTKIRTKFFTEYVKTASNRETETLFDDSAPLQQLPAGVLPAEDGKDFTGAIPPYMFRVDNLHEVLNKYPSRLRFAFSMSMDNGITITRAKYEAAKNSGKKTEIEVDLLIDIPVAFTVGANGGEMPLSSFTGNTIPNDFLGKNSSQQTSPFTDMLNTMRFIQLDASLKNESGFTPNLVFRAKNSTGDIEKSLVLKPGKESPIAFDGDEWQKLRSEETTSTEMYVKFDEGSYTIKKDLELKATFSVVAGLNIDTTL